MKNRFVGDFETTVKADDCRVWGWGFYNIEKDSTEFGNSIESFFDRLFQEPDKTIIYFHNLKFDGEFLLYHLFRNGFSHTQERQLMHKEFSTLITFMGTFYAINIKYKSKEYYIYDSLKIIPLPVSKISKGFGIPQLKGELDYLTHREKGHVLTEKEIDYIRNDVEIVGKALLYFFNQDLTKMTQASNAFFDFKETIGRKKFDKLFPSIADIDEELRESYKGGFAYVNPKYKNKEVGNGVVLDVNSLYPACMYNEMLPYGEPILFEGEYVKDDIYNLYIQIFRCNFELKEGYLPTLQLKRTRGFSPTEYVTSSEGLDVTLCLTSVDIELFFEHYDVYNIEWFNGWKFKSTDTIFKSYIDKWIKIKNQATIDGNEGMRTMAKLMLNALYGKFGLNPEVQNKIPQFDGENIRYIDGGVEQRKPIYIPMASFITSYARKITISSAQKNIDRFLYADTDSLHLLNLEIPTNIEVDNVELGKWKYEGKFNKAKFLRAKTYIENIFIYDEEYQKLKEDKKKDWIYNPETKVYEQLHVACAGLPKSCHENITFENFHVGKTIEGKLQHKRVTGGVVLKDVDFSIKM